VPGVWDSTDQDEDGKHGQLHLPGMPEDVRLQVAGVGLQVGRWRFDANRREHWDFGLRSFASLRTTASDYCGWGLEKAELAGALDGADAVVGVELAIDVFDVGADGAHGDKELFGDLGVGRLVDKRCRTSSSRSLKARSSGCWLLEAVS